MASSGGRPAAITDCLRAINRDHCRPSLAEAELQKIAASAVRYDPGPDLFRNVRGAANYTIEVA